MENSMLIELPEDWDAIETGFPPVPEGEYAVVVAEIKLDKPKVIQARFRITEDGDTKNRLLFQDYDMNTDAGKRLFKEFAEAVGATADNGRLDLGPIVGAALRVRVKHNESNAKTYGR